MVQTSQCQHEYSGPHAEDDDVDMGDGGKVRRRRDDEGELGAWTN
jgi:hypothetical protein